MRNGVIALRKDRTIALMNDEAYRIFALVRRPEDIGRPFTEVLRERPDAARALAGAFEMSHLPNRAEVRLKDIDRVIGYTLSQVRDDQGEAIGAVMFFKDLTRVEQIEERERLRDRLASLGEMAAGIAHELKNPLAGIEVMAGLLRRQVPDSKDAQSLLADIMSEAKLANAIVVEMLEFVRPIRLQMEHTDLADVLRQSIILAETKARRGDIAVTLNLAPDLPMLEGDSHQLCQVFTNLLTNAFEALNGRGAVSITAAVAYPEDDPALMPGAVARRRRRRRRQRTGRARGADRSDLQSVLHDQDDGDRPGPGHREQDRRRARRPHRRQQQRGDRDAVPDYRADDERGGLVQIANRGNW